MGQTTKQQLYRLLYFALIDLRAEGHDAENRLVFLLADLFHNVPLQLDRLDQGDLAPDDVLGWLRSRAHGTPMEDWFNLRMREIRGDGPDPQHTYGVPPDEQEPRQPR
jgi:hypothetical protein